MAESLVRQIRRRVMCWVGVWVIVCAVTAVAQNVAASGADPDKVGPAFEVAAIRPVGVGRAGGSGFRVEPSGRLKVTASVRDLFWQAYGDALGKMNVITDRRAPKWVDSDEFGVNAKVDEAYMRGWAKLSAEQRMEVVRPMLRRLLADRFHVKFRTEMRKTPVYVLVQAKGGAHVKEVPAPAAWEGDPDEAVAKWTAEHPGQEVPGSEACDSERCTWKAVKMSEAVWQIMMVSQADRMVIDETGLKGFYDFSYAWPKPGEGEESPMQAVEDGLGMKFEARSVAIKTYVILSAEKPGLDGD